MIRTVLRAIDPLGPDEYTAEFRIERADSGETRWVQNHNRTLYAGEGAARRAIAGIGIVVDITQRKRAEEKLRSSEERLWLALDASALGTWEMDLRARTFSASARASALHGRAPGEMLGTEMVHADDRARVSALVMDAARRGESYQVEYRTVWPDGSVHWVAGAGRGLRDDAGQATERLIGTVQDITARKEAERELNEREQRYRTIFDNAAAGVVLVSPDLTIESANETFCGIVGYACSELIGRSVLELLHPDDRELAELARLRAGEIGSYEGERRYLRRDGSVGWLRISVAAERDADGRALRNIAVVMDVTEQKRAEEELRESDRRKDDFIAILAHELRNPLAPIRNAVEILRLVGPGDATLQEARELIERQIDHMVRLIDDLLVMSRLKRNLITLKREPLDLAVVVRDAVDAARPAIEGGNHLLQVSLPGPPVAVEGDAVRLVQVLSNLLNNAARYTETGGRIDIALTTEGAEAVLRVRDNGRGIDPANLEKIFTPFFRGDGKATRDGGGLGIGLALARDLVELHGGRIEARSDGPGRGSEFVVCLPWLAEAGQPAAAPRPEPARSARKLRVLVVEDLRDSAESLAMLLRVDGHEVQIASDGEEGVQLACATRPDVVLLDLGLPKLNGRDACRAMRECGLDRTLIVATTGYGQAEDRRLSSAAGFDAHLVKPVDPTALRALLAAAGARK
jgi:PAS domain S-box-containing protein